MKTVQVEFKSTTYRVVEIEVDENTDVNEKAWEALERDETVSSSWAENAEICSVMK